jgi:hypothetical protein
MRARKVGMNAPLKLRDGNIDFPATGVVVFDYSSFWDGLANFFESCDVCFDGVLDVMVKFIEGVP